MRKVITMTLILSILLVGCIKTNSINKETEKSNKIKTGDNNLSLLLKKKSFSKVEMSCPDVMDEIKYIGYFNKYGGQTFLVTENDVFYEVYVNKLYQNQTNCKKVNESEWETISENNFQLYYYRNASNRLRDKLGSFSYLSNGRDQFVVIDNIPYVMKVSQNKEILNEIEFANNEIIEGISDTGYLTTNKAFYSYSEKIINDCEKYADVECEYKSEYILDEEFSKFYEEIIYFDGSILIDVNYNVYTNNGT